MQVLRATSIFVVALSLVGPPTPALAQAGMMLNIPPEQRIVDTNDDIFLATVANVSDHNATREKPPRVKLKVDSTLRGATQKAIRTDWEEPYDPESWRYFPVRPPLTEAQKQHCREYAKESVANPEVGSKWAIIGLFCSGGDARERFIIQAKYPLSKERLAWIDSQLDLRKQYAAQRNMYRDHWPPRLSVFGNEMLPGARPVTADTELRPGTQVLVKYATTTQASVIQLMEDGQVKIRPRGRDSRGDHIVSRDKLMLYPEALVDPGGPAK
jgi:hypothetical protein